MKKALAPQNINTGKNWKWFSYLIWILCNMLYNGSITSKNIHTTMIITTGFQDNFDKRKAKWIKLCHVMVESNFSSKSQERFSSQAKKIYFSRTEDVYWALYMCLIFYLRLVLHCFLRRKIFKNYTYFPLRSSYNSVFFSNCTNIWVCDWILWYTCSTCRK